MNNTLNGGFIDEMGYAFKSITGNKHAKYILRIKEDAAAKAKNFIQCNIFFWSDCITPDNVEKIIGAYMNLLSEGILTQEYIPNNSSDTNNIIVEKIYQVSPLDKYKIKTILQSAYELAMAGVIPLSYIKPISSDLNKPYTRKPQEFIKNDEGILDTLIRYGKIGAFGLLAFGLTYIYIKSPLPKPTLSKISESTNKLISKVKK